jgi:multiple sugar transport system substrate-binding protein
MTRYLFLPILIVLLAASLVPGDQTLTFVMWKPDHPKLWNRIIGTFEQETGIHVNVQIGPHSSTAAHALVSQKLKNRDPELDVFMMDVVWPAEFAAAGWVASLDDLLPEDQKSDFFAGAIDACTFQGRLYGIPFWTSGGLLYYRTDLLSKYGFQPPKTWGELVRQAEVIVEGEQSHDPAIRGYSGQFKEYEGLVCDMQEFILSNRGHLLDKKAQRSTINLARNIEAVRFVRDRIIGHVAPRGVLTYEEPESLYLFIQGHAVFLRNWPYAWQIANDSKRSRIAGKVGLTMLPHFPGGESVSTLGGWQFAISQFSRKKAVAWRFVEFMTSRRTQKLLAVDASQAPARKSVYNDPEVLAKNPHFSKLLRVFESTRPRPEIPLYPLYSIILQRFYQRALAFKSSAIENLAAEADRKVEELLKLQREAGM